MLKGTRKGFGKATYSLPSALPASVSPSRNVSRCQGMDLRTQNKTSTETLAALRAGSSIPLCEFIFKFAAFPLIKTNLLLWRILAGNGEKKQ